MNKKQQEQMIRDIYQNARTPDMVKSRIDDTLHSLNGQNPADSILSYNTIRRKALPFKKISAIAAAALLCIVGTGFAANKIYQMHLEKEQEYSARLQISSKDGLPKEVKEIEVRVNYIPEGFRQDASKSPIYAFINPENSEAGYYVEEPLLIDETDPLSVTFLKDTQTLTIQGHDALYLCQSYTEDQEWKNETIYILYEDLNRILPVSSWGYADKDELIKLAENIELLPTGNTVSSEGLPRWSEYFQPEGKEDTGAASDYYFMEANVSDMTVHQIGDKFDVPSFLDDDNTTEIQLEASVTDVQVADNLSLLTDDGKIPDEWLELTGADGKLTSDTLNYIKLGDGVNRLPELIRTEQVPLKLVYATVEYTNNSSETIYDAGYLVSLIPIIQEGDTIRIFDRADDTCDYVENEHRSITPEMGYFDVSGGHLDKNYIPKIGPGESATVHLAWVINEDELDKLYLNFQGDNCFCEEGLEIGYVDLNL